MFRRLLVLATLGVMLSGCFVAPMAMIGPVLSGFTPSSILQAGLTQTANYMVKKSTGKTISEHTYEIINHGTLQQAYMPYMSKNKIVLASRSSHTPR